MMSTCVNVVSRTAARAGFWLLVLLSAFLNIFNIWDLGYGNTYYAAAIKSMLTSFSNFFFLSFDSTGFISVDKAPLSLWLDALFAKVFGFSGFTILLPHALAGIAVTILVYKIVERVAGKMPALVAGLAITLSPVNVAVYRNNTPDALLLVFVLLTIWFLMRYFEQNKLRFLVLSAVMLGLGFNTKMLQAYLVLPAIAASILVFPQTGFFKRLKLCALFLAVAAIVSFSWITIVDLTPASMRPFVGGSENNSAWNLAFNYNGSERLFGETAIGGNPGFNVGQKGLDRLFSGEMGSQSAWLLAPVIAFCAIFLFKSSRRVLGRLRGKATQIASHEILAFIGIVFFATGYLFFSYASFFHSYYLNIFALPIALLVGIMFHELRNPSLINRIVVVVGLCIALPVQVALISQARYATWLIPSIIALGAVAALLVLTITNRRARTFAYGLLAMSLLLAPMIWSGYTTLYGNTATAIFVGGPGISGGGRQFAMVQPQQFGYAPNVDGNGRVPAGAQNANPPTAPGGNPPNAGNNGRGPSTGQNFNPPTAPDGNTFDGVGNGRGAFASQTVNTQALRYLRQNYQNEKYFVAVSSQQEATGFILGEDIGNIMTLGGFSGRDKAITVPALKELIQNGEIRFFLLNSQGMGRGALDGGLNTNRDGNNQGGGMFNANQDVAYWVATDCKAVSGISGLYDCGT